MQVRVQVHVPRQVTHERDALLLDHLLEDLGQEGEVVRALLLRELLELVRRGVRVDHEVEELAGRGLAAFVHPVCDPRSFAVASAGRRYADASEEALDAHPGKTACLYGPQTPLTNTASSL